MNFETVNNLISQSKKILITSHFRPDGDAIGSSLGLYNALKQLTDAQIQVVMPSEYANSLKFMHGNEDVLIFNEQRSKAQAAIKNADLVFALDYNAAHRTQEMGRYLEKSSAPVVLIDHHPEPDTNFATHLFSDTSYSSTCEMVVVFLQKMNWEHAITPQVADCLYTGILTDTGRFKYATSPRLLKIAGELLEKGANDNYIINQVFDSMSLNKMQFQLHCLGNRLELIPELRAGILHATREDFERFHHESGFTEGLVNYPLGIEDFVFAAFVTPGEGISKLSLRSKGDFAVNKIAQEFFEGGGHNNAAGGRSKKSIEDTILQLKEILYANKELLQKAQR